jgi:hypothetical protein
MASARSTEIFDLRRWLPSSPLSSWRWELVLEGDKVDVGGRYCRERGAGYRRRARARRYCGQRAGIRVPQLQRDNAINQQATS